MNGRVLLFPFLPRSSELSQWVWDALVDGGPLARPSRLALAPAAAYVGWRTWMLMMQEDKNARWDGVWGGRAEAPQCCRVCVALGRRMTARLS